MWAALVFFFFFLANLIAFYSIISLCLQLCSIFKNRINRHLQIVANIGTA